MAPDPSGLHDLTLCEIPEHLPGLLWLIAAPKPDLNIPRQCSNAQQGEHMMLGRREESSRGEKLSVFHNKLPGFRMVNINYFFNPSVHVRVLKCLSVYFMTYIML